MSASGNEPAFGQLELLHLVNQHWRCVGECNLNAPRTFIGRSPVDCLLVVRDSGVSRVHAEIFITAEKRVYLRCLSKKAIHLKRHDEAVVVEKDSAPRELRNQDNFLVGAQHKKRIKITLRDISERYCAEYSSGEASELRSNSNSDLTRTAAENSHAGHADTNYTEDFMQPISPTQVQPRKPISLTPNIDRARTVSTSPAHLPFLVTKGVQSDSVRVRKVATNRHTPQEQTKIESTLSFESGGKMDTNTNTPAPLGTPRQSSQETESNKPPKSILKSSQRKKKRRKSVRFCAFSDEASIVKAADGSGGVTPAKKVFPPHIQKGISASRTSPALCRRSEMATEPQQPHRRHLTPYPASSSMQMTRRFGLGGPLSSIRRSIRPAPIMGKHLATPRPVGMMDVPLAPRSPSVFTKEFAGLNMRSTLSSRKLLNVVTDLRQTPAKFDRLTPAKRTALDSVYRGLTHLNLRTPRVPDTPMVLEMQLSPIMQGGEPMDVDSDTPNGNSTVANLVHDMVSLLDLQGNDGEDQSQTQPSGGFSLPSFFSSMFPQVSSTNNEPNQSLMEIRDVLKDIPADEENDTVSVMDALRSVANQNGGDALFGPTQEEFIGSFANTSVNYSQVGVDFGHGASFTLGSPSPSQEVVKKMYTPETDHAVARQECEQMFSGLASSLGVPSEEIPAHAAQKVEFALECLKNLEDDNGGSNFDDPGPSFQVNGADTARELSQIFETTEENVSRIVAENLRDGLAELLKDPDQMANMSPETRNFAIASLSELVAGPDSPEKICSLLISAPKTVKSPLSILDGICQFVKTPRSVLKKEQMNRVRINANAQFRDDECEMSDLESQDALMDGLDNGLDLSGLVDDLGDGFGDDQEEPTVALQKDLYSQFKAIDKTERLTIRMSKQEDAAPQESTDELVKLFNEKHNDAPGLDGLGFSNEFVLHRPNDMDDDDDVMDDDALPVEFMPQNVEKPSVVSVMHAANASFTTNESVSISPAVPCISPMPNQGLALAVADEQSHGLAFGRASRIPPSPFVHRRAPRTEIAKQKLGWRKRRLSEPIRSRGGYGVDEDLHELENGKEPEEFESMDVDESIVNGSSRKRCRSEMSPESLGPPRKRIRRASTSQAVRVHDSLSFGTPLEVALSATGNGNEETEHVGHMEEKEFSNESDTEENSDTDSEDDADEVSGNFAVESATATVASDLGPMVTEIGACRGRKRNAPESPRVGKTKLYHRDTDMEELPPCNLARCVSSFSVPIRGDDNGGFSLYGLSWCTKVTVNGFPFLSFDDEEFDESVDEHSKQPLFTEEIVAVDMDDSAQVMRDASRDVPLTPLRRICAQRVKPYPQSAVIRRGSRRIATSFSARPATRHMARFGKTEQPSTPKPKSRRTWPNRPKTDFVQRNRNVAQTRRLSERAFSSSLSPLEEAPQVLEEMSFTREQPPPVEMPATISDADREDSLPSVKDSPDCPGDDQEMVDASSAENVVEELKEDQVPSLYVESVTEYGIEVPPGWSSGKTANEIVADLGFVTQDEVADEDGINNQEEAGDAEMVYSIPIRADQSLAHNEPPRMCRKRLLREVDPVEEHGTVQEEPESTMPHAKRRRFGSPAAVADGVDVVMTDAQKEVTPSVQSSDKNNENSSQPVLRRAKSAKVVKRKRRIVKPVRRSERIASRVRRKSQVDSLDGSVNIEMETPSQRENQPDESESHIPTNEQDGEGDVDMEEVSAKEDDNLAIQDMNEMGVGGLCETEVVMEEPQGGVDEARVDSKVSVEPPVEPILEMVSTGGDSDDEMPSERLVFGGDDEAQNPPIAAEAVSDLSPLDMEEVAEDRADSENVPPPEVVKAVTHRAKPIRLRVGGVELHELRVIDLKKELTRRGLSDKGRKKQLVERLSENMKDDVHKPSTKRKTRATRARTQARTATTTRIKKQTKKLVRQSNSATKNTTGRTRVSTQRNAKQTAQSHVERKPLQPVSMNVTSDVVIVGGVDIKQLRVVDLRRELKKRKMDSSGKKTELVTRLSVCVQQESNNPTHRRRKRRT